MSKSRNIFISHHGKDDRHVLGLKERLTSQGYTIRNSSVDSTKHTDVRPSDRIIQTTLKNGISWAGTFICIIGEKTHTRDWVNYEIKQAHLQGKRIVGIYKHGCKDDVKLPAEFEKYGGPPLGWNSLDKLIDVINGINVPNENPDGTPSKPIYHITRVRCNR